MSKPTQNSAGPLDGLAILRFAHAYAAGGGMERILDDLDGIILERNAATIIRFYIGQSKDEVEREVAIGRGRLQLIPLPLAEGDERPLASDEERPPGFKQRVRDALLYRSLFWRLFGRRYCLKRAIPRRRGEMVGAGARFERLARERRIDLCMMHFFGSADADEIITQARKRSIPVALENHYANDRFDNLSIRKHVLLADAVGGMNGLDVPKYVASRFVNLSDGIDLSCFDPAQARPVPGATGGNIVFMPARIVRPKGQMDLVLAAAELRQRGIDLTLAFAGRVDSAAFAAELRHEVKTLGLEDRVHFLGQLPAAQVRDWMAASSVMAFPTYHHEGLGRIIVEAQAMGVPVVAYGTGGVREGIQDGVTGYLLPTGARAQLADRLGQLVTDESLRRRMGEAGRRFVQDRFSLDALARRHESFYLSALAGRSLASR